MKLIDTNVLFELLTNGPRFSSCEQIIRRVESGQETAAMSPISIAELHYLLKKREKISGKGLEKMFETLFAIKSIRILTIDATITQEGVRTANQFNIDLADAINVVLMQKNAISEIYSFDSDFDRFKNIKRLIE